MMGFCRTSANLIRYRSTENTAIMVRLPRTILMLLPVLIGCQCCYAQEEVPDLGTWNPEDRSYEFVDHAYVQPPNHILAVEDSSDRDLANDKFEEGQESQFSSMDFDTKDEFKRGADDRRNRGRNRRIMKHDKLISGKPMSQQNDLDQTKAASSEHSNQIDGSSEYSAKDRNALKNGKHSSKLSVDSDRNVLADKSKLPVKVSEHKLSLHSKPLKIIENSEENFTSRSIEDKDDSLQNQTPKSINNNSNKKHKNIHHNNVKLRKNSYHLENQKVNGIPLQRKKKKTKNKGDDINKAIKDFKEEAQSESQTLRNNNLSRGIETVPYNNNNNFKTKHESENSYANISLINKGFLNAVQNKYLFPHKKELSNNYKSPNQHDFNPEQSITKNDLDHSVSWIFNEHRRNALDRKDFDRSKVSDDGSVKKCESIKPDFKTGSLENSSIDMNFTQSKHAVDDVMMKNEDFNTLHNNGFPKSSEIKHLIGKKKSKKLHSDPIIPEKDIGDSSVVKKYKHSKKKERQKISEEASNGEDSSLPFQNSFKSKLTINNNFGNLLEHLNHGESIKRNERDTSRRNHMINVYNPDVDTESKGVFGTGSSDDSEDIRDTDYQDQAHERHFARDEDDQRSPQVLHKPNGDARYISRDLNSERKHKTEHPYKENDSEKLFAKRAHLSRLNGDEPEDTCVEMRGHVTTSFAQDTTSTEKTTACITKESKEPKPKTKKPESTKKPDTEKEHNNLNQGEVNEYEQFLDGQLVDDFVKRVLEKVTRSRKIMRELGFSNDTEDTCERCVELKPSKMPDVEDIKKSMENILNHDLKKQDTLTCYRVPDPMEKYLSVLLSYEQEHENSVYNKIENDNSFIFTGDFSEPLSRIDNGLGISDKHVNRESLSKDLFEKQRLREENNDEKSDNRIISRNAFKFSKPTALHTETHEDDSTDTMLDEELESGIKQSRKEESDHISLKSKNNMKEKYMIPESNNLALKPSLRNKMTSYKYFGNNDLGHSHDGNAEPDVISGKKSQTLRNEHGSIKESDNKVERNARKPNYEEGNTAIAKYLEKSDKIRHPQFGQGFNSQTDSKNNIGHWSRSKQGGRLPSRSNNDFLRPYSMPDSINEKSKYVYFHPNEYGQNPQMSMKSSGNDEYQLYPDQRDLDVDDSLISSPDHGKEYGNEARMVKRDTEPSEPYEDDDSPVFFEVPDIEYDLY